MNRTISRKLLIAATVVVAAGALLVPIGSSAKPKQR